jgi:tRNA A37 N6-isopentenylltransferase MiaA
MCNAEVGEIVTDKSISPVILVGPTFVGKSALAGALAGGLESWAGTYPTELGTRVQIVAADKYYLYAKDPFMLGLGLTPAELNDGRQRPLHGSLDPRDPLPTTDAYLAKALDAIDQVHADGDLAVVEGCSYSYAMALIGHFGVQHAIRLTWPTSELMRLGQTISDAFDSLVNLGLYEETERGLSAGYEHTYPMSSLIYQPTIRAVRGEITSEDAASLVVTKWIDEACRTDKRFAEVPGLLTLTPQI